jgi:2-C-methyl-D-erythritol 2,4-cyclodiphosphate synthase
MSFRVGQGYDVHAFTDGDSLVLGGVRIPFDKAFEAHSDGDVLIHALCDALLGAAGQGDIGRHFPDNNEAYANIDSRKLLEHVVELIFSQGWEIVNADITIIAQQPKMGPHIQAMEKHLAEDMDIPVNAINVKATTTERLGFEGKGEGIACSAVVLIQER